MPSDIKTKSDFFINCNESTNLSLLFEKNNNC